MLEERLRLHDARKEGSLNEATRKEIQSGTIDAWQRRWERGEDGKGDWTRRLVKNVRQWVSRKHGYNSHWSTQLRSGHGCFQSYLFRIKKAESETCAYCPAFADNAEHTLVESTKWDAQRLELCSALGVPVDTDRKSVV